MGVSERRDYAASEGVSTFVSQGGRSAADRSGTEITEYHHYAASSSAAQQQQQQFGWYEEEETETSTTRAQRRD